MFFPGSNSSNTAGNISEAVTFSNGRWPGEARFHTRGELPIEQQLYVRDDANAAGWAVKDTEALQGNCCGPVFDGCVSEPLAFRVRLNPARQVEADAGEAAVVSKA